MPGPPPKRHARRRRGQNNAGWLTLPAAGRRTAKGRPAPAPKFPIARPARVPPGAPSKAAVTALWRELWRTPQAVAWERFSWTRLVARYTVKLLLSESDDAPAALQSEVRQLEDRLGLSPMAMKRLQWEIAEPQVGTDQESPADVVNLADYHARLAGGRG